MFGDPQVTRDILGQVPAWLVTTFYLSAFAAIGYAGFWLALRLRQYRRARPHPTALKTETSSISWGRVAALLGYLTFQRPLMRDRYSGVAHLLTFHGFVILFIGTCLVFLEHQTPLHFFYGWFYCIASLVIDLGGVAFLVGLGMFLARRHVAGSPRLLQVWWVAALGWLLGVIGVSGFLLEAARIARDLPGFERWSIVGYVLALGLQSAGIAGERAVPLQQWLWAGHAVLCVVFFALLPWKFFRHVIFAPLAWLVRTERPRAELTPPVPSPGVSQWTDLTWRDLVHADGCTTCGRCNSVCPAAAAGKPLYPRDVVLAVRQALDEPGVMLADRVADDVLWSCTTCGACNEACPVGIDVYHKIVALRRGRVETGRVPDVAVDVFEGSALDFNPYRRAHADRLAWAGALPLPLAAEDEPIELLYWVGCAGSFDRDGQSVARAMVRLLNHLGVRYRVLGTRERCTGDPARRMGEEGLFRELAAANLGTFAAHRVQTILTHCPHCYNTFRNEYPAISGPSVATPAVMHHSQFLAAQIAQGKLRTPRPLEGAATFHDPCYLGRGNGEVAAPRAVLAGLQELPIVEMPRSGRESFCCGAGGGSLWLDVRGDERVENLRWREAVATGATTVVTGCPFCKTMLEAARQTDATNGQSAPRRVRDLAELVAEAEGLS